MGVGVLDAESAVGGRMIESDKINLGKGIRMRIGKPSNDLRAEVQPQDVAREITPVLPAVDLHSFRHSLHSQCIVCGQRNARGLHLSFQRIGRNGVEATIGNLSEYEGYSGTLHGGMIALLLDGAMTNCLFALEKVGVTAQLSIRYKLPVMTDKKATIQARLIFSKLGLFKLQAWIIQGGRVCVQATGKFIEKRPPLCNYSKTPGIVKPKK